MPGRELVKHPYRRTRQWEFMTWKDIPSKVDRRFVHLRRFRIIATPLFGVFIHWIFEPDMDRDPHDHPWPFFSIVLRGMYQEVIYPYVNVHRDLKKEVRVWPRFSTHRFPLDIAHQISRILPGTVTLVFVGRRRGGIDSNWYFHTADGPIHHTHYDEYCEANS